MSKQLDKCISFDRKDTSKLQVDFRYNQLKISIAPYFLTHYFTKISSMLLNSLLLQLKAIQEGYRKRSHGTKKLKNKTNAKSNTDPLPRETELLQSVLKARFGKDVFLVTHPVIEAFVHFKWLVVRKFFFVLRSIYVS